MTRLAILALATALLAAPAAAQQMDHSHMPGMQMPAPPSAPPAAPKDATADMPGMAHPAPPTPAPPAPAPGPAAAPAETAPPAWTGDYAADRYFDPAAMAHARAMAREEMGGMRFSKIMLNLAEYQTGSHGDGYRWDGEAWFGGDINRLMLRSEGEGSTKDGLDAAEAQVLYSRAVGPYLDLQAGLRQDFSPRARTYLAVGAQKLVPYWLDVESSLFLSTKGELLARAEGTYDFRLTQRLVLQPRAELNFAAQDTPETRTGRGLSSAELGLRLRYEIRRELAPYIGISWDRRLGRTARYVRAAGEHPEATTFVVGLRTWF